MDNCVHEIQVLLLNQHVLWLRVGCKHLSLFVVSTQTWGWMNFDRQFAETISNWWPGDMYLVCLAVEENNKEVQGPSGAFKGGLLTIYALQYPLFILARAERDGQAV